MEYSIKGKALTVVFPESISSTNASTVSEALFQAVADHAAESVCVDLRNTVYISSAGLRVLLKLQKSGCETELVNASAEVYDIFAMTGFTEIMKIAKKRRTISIENAVLIGEGYSSKVYRITEDSIVKVFIRDTSLADIQRELNLAKKAFVLGIPTAISYDVVEVDGHYGVIFELINCGLLRDALLGAPDEFETYMQKYVRLLLTLNTTDVGDTELPDMKRVYLQRVPFLRKSVSEQDYNDIVAFISDIPDVHTFVHGDCHIKNIMYSGKELLLIDMDTLSYGSPIFELAQIYSSYMMFPSVYEGNCEQFFAIPRALATRMTERILHYYFADADAPIDEGETQRIKRLAQINLMLFLAEYEPDDTEGFQKAYRLYRDFEMNH